MENPGLLHKYLTTKGIVKLAEKQPELIPKGEAGNGLHIAQLICLSILFCLLHV